MTKEQRIRFSRLNQVFNKALSQSVTKLENWDKLRSCFPEYSSTREGASNLVNCQKQVIDFWTELCKREFEEILVERDVKNKLDELDDLIYEAKERLRDVSSREEVKTTPIDQLSSEQLVDCNVYSERSRAIGELNERLDALNTLNENLEVELIGLEDDLDAGRKEITSLCNSYMGDTIDEPLDETLVQGLGDMLLELHEVT